MVRHLTIRTGYWLATCLLGLYACTPSCKDDPSISVTTSLRGTWKLVQLVSPSKTQTRFSPQQRLVIDPNNHIGGYPTAPLLAETFLSDTTKVGTATWKSTDGDCEQNIVTVTYEVPAGLLRKYSLIDNIQGLRATGYVNQNQAQQLTEHQCKFRKSPDNVLYANPQTCFTVIISRLDLDSVADFRSSLWPADITKQRVKVMTSQ